MEKKKITASENIPEFHESLENMPEEVKQRVDNKLKSINETCTLTDAELVAACEKWVDRLCKSGGDAWGLEVPVSMNRDPDMLFTELIRRFNNPQPGAWVKASDRLPGIKTPVKWREGEREMKVEPVWYMVLDSNSEYLSKCEWFDESAAPASPAEQPVAWISAETKPEHNVGCLVFIPGEDNHITSGMWDIDNKWVLLDDYRTPEEAVTHWMPLPALPEGYTRNEIPSEWVSALKEVAREELAKKAPEQPVREEEADMISVMLWAFVHISSWDKASNRVHFFTGKTYTVNQLPGLFKQQKENNNG